MKNQILCTAILLAGVLAGSSLATEWTTPVPVETGINTQYTEATPYLSYDGLSLYYTEYYSSSVSAVIFEARRSQPWGNFTSVSQVFSTSGHAYSPWVSPDNLRMYYHQEASTWRINMSQRASVNDPWPQGTMVAGLPSGVCAPSLSEDELTIVFNNPSVGSWDMYIATRPDRNSPFGSIRNLSEINTAGIEMRPFLSPDALSIYWASGSGQIFEATRQSLNEPFGNVQQLTAFNMPSGSAHPSISGDGKTFFFVTGVAGQATDIYFSSLIPESAPIANAGGPYTIYAGDTLTLDASGSTDDDNDIVFYQWDLDDDGAFETDAGDQPVFDVNFAYLQSLGLTAGNTYNIRVKVTDSEDQNDVNDTTLTILEMPAVQVAVDIRPGSCPNPFNPKSMGVFKAAILGSEDFDVTAIDINSILLADAVPVRFSFQDTASRASDSNDCNCSTGGPDGFVDLVLMFETQEVADSLADILGELDKGDIVTVPLTGALLDLTRIEGQDCVTIVGNQDDNNKKVGQQK